MLRLCIATTRTITLKVLNILLFCGAAYHYKLFHSPHNLILSLVDNWRTQVQVDCFWHPAHRFDRDSRHLIRPLFECSLTLPRIVDTKFRKQAKRTNRPFYFLSRTCWAQGKSQKLVSWKVTKKTMRLSCVCKGYTMKRNIHIVKDRWKCERTAASIPSAFSHWWELS